MRRIEREPRAIALAIDDQARWTIPTLLCAAFTALSLALALTPALH